MNVLEGEIHSIETKDHLSLVKVNVKDVRLTSIIIDTPDNSEYLTKGNVIKVFFKETEVILGTGSDFPISLQNRLSGKVSRIEKGSLLSKVVIECSVGNITSIITTTAVNQLGLENGMGVTAMIKTNEIMLSV